MAEKQHFSVGTGGRPKGGGKTIDEMTTDQLLAELTRSYADPDGDAEDFYCDDCLRKAIAERVDRAIKT
jgi:hypothetical protein